MHTSVTMSENKWTNSTMPGSRLQWYSIRCKKTASHMISDGVATASCHKHAELPRCVSSCEKHAYHALLSTHTEVWMLLLVAAVMSVIAKFIEPVVFSCYEKVPRQQGSNAHQKENDVHQIVRVLWTIAHSQRWWGILGEKRRREAMVFALFVFLIRFIMVTKCIRKIWWVKTGVHRPCTVHFHRLCAGYSQSEGCKSEEHQCRKF